MTGTITDGQLSAYLDGTGDPEALSAIDKALSENAGLRARLEWLRRNDAVLRDALDAQLGEVPARLHHIASGSIAVAPVAARARTGIVRRRLAIAASVALAFVVGAGLDRLYTEAPRSEALAYGASGLTAGPQLAGVMSTAYSQAPVATDAGIVSVALSFEAGDGRLCRKFRIEHDARADVGVACRSGSEWAIAGWYAGASAKPRTGFETASGPNDAPIDAVIDRLGMRSALDRAGEAKAINSGWSRGNR